MKCEICGRKAKYGVNASGHIEYVTPEKEKNTNFLAIFKPFCDEHIASEHKKIHMLYHLKGVLSDANCNDCKRAISYIEKKRKSSDC